MILLLTYLIGALSISFLCSVLEAVLLSTPMSFVTMKEADGSSQARLLKKYKTDIDKPIAAILSLNTVAHTIGAAGVGAEAVKIFGEASFRYSLGSSYSSHFGFVGNYTQDHRRVILAQAGAYVGFHNPDPCHHHLSSRLGVRTYHQAVFLEGGSAVGQP